ncbi:hypothetical protein ID858_18970, partial [Xenorhabdus sp. DI]|nr:hypothetical protein [Xenorhabdus sp. 3]MBD2790548.1 hypothetical protein [Xenorhabdus sp. DI]
MPEKSGIVATLDDIDSRKINGKSLSSDISLSASDVGAYSRKESDEKFLPRSSNSSARVGALTVDNNNDWPGVTLQSSTGYSIGIEGT